MGGCEEEKRETTVDSFTANEVFPRFPKKERRFLREKIERTNERGGNRCILLRRRRFLAVYLGSRKEEEEEEMPREEEGVEKRERKEEVSFSGEERN